MGGLLSPNRPVWQSVNLIVSHPGIPTTLPEGDIKEEYMSTISSTNGPILPNDLSNLRGCIHKDRPTAKTCHNCGEPLCYECYFDAQVGARVTAATNVDREVQADYAVFCAACYLEWAKKKFGRLMDKPNLITAPFDDAFKYAQPGGFFYLAITLLFTPVLIGLLFWWVSYDSQNSKYDKQAKAFDIVRQHRAAK
jgi:hypothetical protein